MNTTLLIMAAGIGSRFGTGIKQLEPVDDANHIIMDYSIHDAIEAGFNHVVFIIRKDIEKERIQRGHRRPHCLHLFLSQCNGRLCFPGYQRHSGNSAGRTYKAVGNRSGCAGSEGCADNTVYRDQCG